MAYRLSRNVEASLIEYLRTELFNDNWTGIAVEKSVKQEKLKPPIIVVNVVDVETQRLEIGNGKYIKYPLVVIRIFADNDGQRLDLADWVLEKLEGNISYYKYSIFDGQVDSKDYAGNIVVLSITRNEKELATTDPSALEKEDRYRHNISFKCFIGELPQDC